MANRRMFSLDIVNSDQFLDMPMSAQALYFHLGMRADDDGFLGSARTIMRMIGASPDDLRILCAKGYVIVFPDGVMVITHWALNNYIQSDRKRETIYKEHLQSLEITASKAYLLPGECIQDVSKMDSQYRLGKDRLDKINNSCLSAERHAPKKRRNRHEYSPLFERCWKEYIRKEGKGEVTLEAQDAIEADGEGVVLSGIRAYNAKQFGTPLKYVKMGSTFFNSLAWRDYAEMPEESAEPLSDYDRPNY